MSSQGSNVLQQSQESNGSQESAMDLSLQGSQASNASKGSDLSELTTSTQGPDAAKKADEVSLFEDECTSVKDYYTSSQSPINADLLYNKERYIEDLFGSMGVEDDISDKTSLIQVPLTNSMIEKMRNRESISANCALISLYFLGLFDKDLRCSLKDELTLCRALNAIPTERSDTQVVERAKEKSDQSVSTKRALEYFHQLGSTIEGDNIVKFLESVFGEKGETEITVEQVKGSWSDEVFDLENFLEVFKENLKVNHITIISLYNEKDQQQQVGHVVTLFKLIEDQIYIFDYQSVPQVDPQVNPQITNTDVTSYVYSSNSSAPYSIQNFINQNSFNVFYFYNLKKSVNEKAMDTNNRISKRIRTNTKTSGNFTLTSTYVPLNPVRGGTRKRRRRRKTIKRRIMKGRKRKTIKRKRRYTKNKK
jgi:hypothetical protein